jgi:hypothetical protein
MRKSVKSVNKNLEKSMAAARRRLRRHGGGCGCGGCGGGGVCQVVLFW